MFIEEINKRRETIRTCEVTLGNTELRVTGDFDKGEPETGPTFDCGGTPAVPPSFTITEIEVKGTSRDSDDVWVDLTELLGEGAFEAAFLNSLESACLEEILKNQRS